MSEALAVYSVICLSCSFFLDMQVEVLTEYFLKVINNHKMVVVNNQEVIMARVGEGKPFYKGGTLTDNAQMSVKWLLQTELETLEFVEDMKCPQQAADS